MDEEKTANRVLECIGGAQNVLENSLCMTRLRLTVQNPTLIDREGLIGVDGVLGIAGRGPNGIEVVFGPSVVKDVHKELVKITGIEPSPTISHEGVDTSPIIKVQIATDTPRKGAYGAKAKEDKETAKDNSSSLGDLDALSALMDESDDFDLDFTGPDDPLKDLFDDIDEEDESEEKKSGRRVLVLNGPNINMLGIREPDLYGTKDYSDLLNLCKETALKCGFIDCYCYQSNHEGDLIDKIQDAWQVFDAIVINPAAYTHTSVALLDALKSVDIPTVEVHISQVSERESFRQISYVRAACVKTIIGEGIDGYAHAIEYLWNYLEEREAQAHSSQSFVAFVIIENKRSLFSPNTMTEQFQIVILLKLTSPCQVRIPHILTSKNRGLKDMLKGTERGKH